MELSRDGGTMRGAAYFAETYAAAFAAGARVFDVALEGAVALDDYDVFADVGSLKGRRKEARVAPMLWRSMPSPYRKLSHTGWRASQAR